MTFDPKSWHTHGLQGSSVHLTPLQLEDAPGLTEIGLDPRIWEWMTHAVRDGADMGRYVEAALEDRDAGLALPFATRDAATGALIGTTRFGSIVPRDLRAEIGWTWLTPSRWRTGVNVEAKRLMLQFAFETLGLRRVELKTDSRNGRSRAAMEGIGATFEGIFRKHMITEGGGVRNSAFYSITDDEWPAVRAALDARMTR